MRSIVLSRSLPFQTPLSFSEKPNVISEIFRVYSEKRGIDISRMSGDAGLNVSTPPLVQIAVTNLMDTTPDNMDSGSEHDALNVSTLALVQKVVFNQMDSLLDNMDSGSYHDDACDEPPMKHRRVEVDYDINSDTSIKQILFNINKAICIRLDSIENSLTMLCDRAKEIEEKVDTLMSAAKQNAVLPQGAVKKGAFVVGLPQHCKTENGDAGALNSVDSIASLGPNVTLITLNSEEDYPNGTWLGDESNVEMRVRCGVSPSDILHIHSNCRTPEKMALTLLDYIFDRETQATSNLSGMGKHGKRQLDPLMIYGIRCHLIHKFGITEQDWHRIKQNIDSKCRTAFRRKQRGMPLTVKAFRGKSLSNYPFGDMISDDDSLNHDDALHLHQRNASDVYLHGDIDLAQTMQGDPSLQGEVQILHATPEQISQLQHAQHIQILQGDQVIQVPVPVNDQHIQQLNAADLPEGIQVAVSSVTLSQMEPNLTIQSINSDNNSDIVITQNN